MLTLLASETVDPERAARLQRGGGQKLAALIQRDWVTATGGTWTVTDEGRAAQARLAEIVAGIRAKVSGTVSGDDFTTTMTSLEAIAEGLGWDPAERMPRGFGHRRGFGPHERRCDNGTERSEHGHPHRGHGRGRRGTEQAFERGFTAGFAAASARA